jgi:hypothetical protein
MLSGTAELAGQAAAMQVLCSDFGRVSEVKRFSPPWLFVSAPSARLEA